jgi:hypothetical protein
MAIFAGFSSTTGFYGLPEVSHCLAYGANNIAVFTYMLLPHWQEVKHKKARNRPFRLCIFTDENCGMSLLQISVIIRILIPESLCQYWSSLSLKSFYW